MYKKLAAISIFETKLKNLQIIPYNPTYKNQWNEFVKKSANGCFLHDRNFMDYHADRFEDHSLMFFDKEELAACFPAHQSGSTLHSHLGLSYGALLTLKQQVEASSETRQIQSVNANIYPGLLQNLVNYSKDKNFEKLELKLPPPFFDPYFEKHYKNLFEWDFQTIEESLDLVVYLKEDWLPSPKKTIGYRNGKFDSLQIVVSEDLKEFWNELLIPQLQKRHDAKPTHTLEEIELLQSRFPSQILQYYVEHEGHKIAGITLFDYGNILKVQYAAANPTGFERNAMDFLYLEIIQEAKDQGREFVDLGTVNNRDGSINEGLLRFKKQLGAVVTPVVEIALNLRS